MKADYNTDFFLWTQQQAAFLRQGVLSDIDMANLAEEIESMGKSGDGVPKVDMDNHKMLTRH